MTLYPIVITYATLAGTALFLLRESWRKPSGHAATYEVALEAAKLMKDWGTWMTTVSTAVIAANGLLISTSSAPTTTSPLREPSWAYWSVLCFGLSITFAAWLIGSLPSVVLRLKKPQQEPLHAEGRNPSEDVTSNSSIRVEPAKPDSFSENDIYELRFFTFVPVRLGVVAALQHVFFVLGLYSFSLYAVAAKWSYSVSLSPC